MDNPYFRAGQIDTDFLAKHFDPHYEQPVEGEDAALIAAALLTHLRFNGRSTTNGTATGGRMPAGGAWKSAGRRLQMGGRRWRAR
jgi:hypothetical protein